MSYDPPTPLTPQPTPYDPTRPTMGELLPWKGRYWRVAQVKREGEKLLVLLEARGETGGALKRRLAVEKQQEYANGTSKRSRLASP